MFDLFGNPVTMQSTCKVAVCGNSLRIDAPYNVQFIALIKSLPQTARQFDPNTKTWLVDTQYTDKVREWICRIYGEDIGEITQNNFKPQTEIRILDVWYIGKTKPNGDEYIANGMNAQKEWVFLFPERVLKDWFEGFVNQVNGPTLYGILGVHRNALPDEIKNAYRRLARQWHPDVCKEPNAHETFLKIKEAYEILSNRERKAKYDAGLALEATLGKQQNMNMQSSGYRSPLRCGYILAEGYEKLKRFYVTKILEWQDIETDQGVLTVSWSAATDQLTWKWV